MYAPLFTVLTIGLSAAFVSAAETVTVTKTVETTHTRTVYNALASASCTNPAELTGFRASMGYDPLQVAAQGKAFLGAETPSNDPTGAYSGSGYLVGHWRKSKSNLDVLTVFATNITIVPNTQYAYEIYSRHTGAPNKFCQIYLSATTNTGGSGGGIRCDVSGTDWESCSAIFNSGSATSVTNVSWRMQCFPNGGSGASVAYDMLFDEARLYSM